MRIRVPIYASGILRPLAEAAAAAAAATAAAAACQLSNEREAKKAQSFVFRRFPLELIHARTHRGDKSTQFFFAPSFEIFAFSIFLLLCFFARKYGDECAKSGAYYYRYIQERNCSH